MKQDVFLSEVFLIISHSDVQTSWYETIEEFTKKSLQDKDIDISFYNTLANFNTAIASLTNKIPLFLDSPNIDSLRNYFKAIESNQKVTNDFKFLCDYLFSYLSQFENEEINYNIEINDVGELFDTILYYIETELDIDN